MKLTAPHMSLVIFLNEISENSIEYEKAVLIFLATYAANKRFDGDTEIGEFADFEAAKWLEGKIRRSCK